MWIENDQLRTELTSGCINDVMSLSDMISMSCIYMLMRLMMSCYRMAGADVLVDELLKNLDCADVQVESIEYHSVKRSYAAAAGGRGPASDKTGSILVTVGSVQEKGSLLRARKRLKDSCRLSSMGVNEDLTQKQQEAKSAAWPAYQAARREGKRAFWKADKLIVDGCEYTPDKRPATQSISSADTPDFTHTTMFSPLPSQASA